jgi:hypothetical protein
MNIGIAMNSINDEMTRKIDPSRTRMSMFV